MSLLIDEKELQDRLESCELVYHRIGKGNDNEHENAGRKIGDKNVVPFIRGLIAAEAIEGKGTQKEIAEAWGVSPSSVSNYKDGKTTNGELKGSHPDILKTANKIVKKRKEKIINKTAYKLLEVMKAIDTRRVANEKPLIQSQIARNLATTMNIVEGKEKDDESSNSNNVHFHVHVPPPIKVEVFDSVTIEEKTFKK